MSGPETSIQPPFDARSALESLGLKENPKLQGSFSSDEPLKLVVNALGGEITQFASSAPDSPYETKEYDGSPIPVTGADVLGNEVTLYAGGNMRVKFDLASVKSIVQQESE